jgi:cytidylate kinase
MSIVAVSETMGSLGSEIGRHLSQWLGYEFADQEIIAKAAERFGESVLDLTHVTEEKPTLWERFSDTKRRYMSAVEAIIFEMAARGRVILSGRSATILLRDVGHVLRVRIIAPERVRAERIRNQQGLTEEAAADFVRHADRERAARVRFLYNLDWDDPLLYDLVLNTDRLTVEGGTHLIAQALADERFRPTPESRRRLADLNVGAQVKITLLEHPRTRGLHLYTTCADGYVVMTGRVEEEEQRRLIQELVEKIPGVTGVQNDVVAVGPALRGIPRGI